VLKARFPGSFRFDLLETDLFFELSKNPARFRDQLLAEREDKLRLPVIIDEIQKVPQLLDEVHWLIEHRGLRFILSGTSARKLRRSRVQREAGANPRRHSRDPFEKVPRGALGRRNHRLIRVTMPTRVRAALEPIGFTDWHDEPSQGPAS
jgi:hypothetical protein